MTCVSLQDKQVYSGESGIFQREWGSNSKGLGANLLFGNFFQNCMKMKLEWEDCAVSLTSWIKGTNYIATLGFLRQKLKS